MAINDRIRKKITAKTSSESTKKSLMNILNGLEQGKQGKRLIEREIDKIAKE